jgi:hypothetical protein
MRTRFLEAACRRRQDEFGVDGSTPASRDAEVEVESTPAEPVRVFG